MTARAEICTHVDQHFTHDLSLAAVDDRRAVVIRYLSGGRVMFMAATMEPDEVNGEQWAVPVGQATDGLVTWSMSVTYYADRYGVGVPAELLAHIREQLAARPDAATGDATVFVDDTVTEPSEDNGWVAPPADNGWNSPPPA